MMRLGWFIPGAALAFALALVAGPRVSRAVGARRLIGSCLVLAVGLILAATLSPLTAERDSLAPPPGTCDFSRISLLPVSALLALDDRALNVLLFVPLGLVIAALPRRRITAAIAIGAIALPFAIETIQLVAIPLERSCQGADVVDNLTGLVVGLIVTRAWIALQARTGRDTQSPS